MIISPMSLIVCAVVLGAGTFAFRFAGPALRAKVELNARAEKLMAAAAVVLLAALVATSALIEGTEFAGFARPAGVLVGGVLAWRKAPFVVVVLAAAATAAGLRLLGVP
ncbi:Branched-chain amino acid transport protein (AzlD) [Amycolatopsis sp. YIM 10]|nr:Branched-chain amino acid transport protein (AzlD) [Amycolatopsis sp. YIM 10]